MARFQFLFKQKLKGMGLRLADSASSADYTIEFDPLLLSIDKKRITITDSVKGKLLSGNFIIYAAELHISYLLKKGDVLWYNYNTQREMQELYKSRTIKEGALLYTIFTDHKKWEQDGRFQLQHLGFDQKSIDRDFEALAGKLAKDFRKASRKMPVNMTLDK